MTTSRFPTGLVQAIGGTALVAGTLDIATALTKYFLTTGRSPLNVLRYVASGLWGPAALTGGLGLAAGGLLLHYLIALLWTSLFFWLYPRLRLRALPPVVVGLLYGVLVWLAMNLLVVPASRIPTKPMRFWPAAIELLVIMVCVGLPIALGARSYYRRAAAPASGR